MTTRLAAARLLVQNAYVHPAPTFPPRTPTPDERPAVGRQTRELARAHGFVIRETFTRGTGLPKWRVANSSAPETYYGLPADIYVIGGVLGKIPLTTKAANSAYLERLDPETLVAFEVVYLDGKPSGAVIRRAGHSKEAVTVTVVVAELKRLG